MSWIRCRLWQWACREEGTTTTHRLRQSSLQRSPRTSSLFYILDVVGAVPVLSAAVRQLNVVLVPGKMRGPSSAYGAAALLLTSYVHTLKSSTVYCWCQIWKFETVVNIRTYSQGNGELLRLITIRKYEYWCVVPAAKPRFSNGQSRPLPIYHHHQPPKKIPVCLHVYTVPYHTRYTT